MTTNPKCLAYPISTKATCTKTKKSDTGRVPGSASLSPWSYHSERVTMFLPVRLACYISGSILSLQKPALAAIASSKQEGENVCEGVILCVGEKCF